MVGLQRVVVDLSDKAFVPSFRQGDYRNLLETLYADFVASGSPVHLVCGMLSCLDDSGSGALPS